MLNSCDAVITHSRSLFQVHPSRFACQLIVYIHTS